MDAAELAQIRVKPVYRRRPEFVYFVWDGSAIKIGISNDPKRRVAYMQVGHPSRLQLLKMTRGTKDTEDELKHQFRHLNISGEWFRPAPELLDFIEAIPKYEAPSSPNFELWFMRRSEVGWPNKEAELAAFMVLNYQRFCRQFTPFPALLSNLNGWVNRLAVAMAADRGSVS
jgi:hypothetical protein